MFYIVMEFFFAILNFNAEKCDGEMVKKNNEPSLYGGSSL